MPDSLWIGTICHNNCNLAIIELLLKERKYELVWEYCRAIIFYALKVELNQGQS